MADQRQKKWEIGAQRIKETREKESEKGKALTGYDSYIV